MQFYSHLEKKIVWPSAVRNWELLNGAKIRFHGNVPGSSRSEVNENLPNVPAAFGGESVRDSSTIWHSSSLTSEG